MQPRWHEPKNTAEGELLQHVLQLEQIVKMRKNMNCMGCKSDDCPSCSKKASEAGQIKVTDADKHNNKVFADIMGDGDEDAAHKNYEEASEMDRKGQFKPNRGDEKKPTLKGRGGMLSNFDFSKNTDKGMPIGEGGQRMNQEEAMGGGKNDRMGQPYTVDPRVRDMHSRRRYEDGSITPSGRGKEGRGYRNTDSKITRTPRPEVGQRSDFSTEGDGSSVLAPKPDWMVDKGDITSQFLASKGVIVKYEQEGSVKNGVPQFMDHSGGTPIEARPYQTNGTYPDFSTVAPKVKGISEVAKMPAYAKTGYDEKGSSVHMHLTDGGDRKDGNWNIAPIEESLTQLRKGYGNPGIIEEIASLMENVAKNL
tara:strand:+ start:6999 stop:8093 length:1095 start_codon:yes stop_codon:yes gene_type:complete